MTIFARGMLLAAFTAFSAGSASAADLTIGLGGAVSALDPHYHNVATNNMVTRHIFGRLVDQDAKQKLVPDLAESWKAIDDTTWEFKLRKGVKFHDGSDFDAKDVVATLSRVPWVPNSPSSFSIFTGQIIETKVIDAHTVQLKTATPFPLMPTFMAGFAIISDQFERAPTEDFNSGKAAIGTGPFKYAQFARGDRIELARFDGFWGPKPDWEKVTIKQITNSAARVAALLSGDVQIIDQVPTADFARLKKDKNVNVSSVVSNRVIYLSMDTNRDQTPFVTAKDGKPLEKNPLKDVRVRKAMSMAINRPAIVDRVMEGQAIAAAQFLPDGFFGTSKTLKVEKFDADGARKLMAEAGYKDGFALTIHSPNDRYLNDEKITQAVAQMFSRIGIQTKVEAIPFATYSPRATKLEFSMMLWGWGSGTGEVSSPLRSFIATYDPKKGNGPSNRGRYSNPRVDELLGQALQTVDDAAREKLLQQATETAILDVAIIPLHYNINNWATRAGFTYEPRTDESTLATGVKAKR
ncbi:peptide/nickel transport system substrate-binding protein [Stella humosa]|uniref:Peptide/nickel transport system substrate-binding protein n=1 Tax=Stella humosa TaxID=94 RepID=A0A3N1MEA4_9PROT|nr:ABC transporter substrate-binding protein [Stella humosa]ROQ01888.1 peptide/nickel transport system substrate-binding protein [Stella humosa]BBK32277.1 ABC transporter substrate-binding protein [Stella humosa]